jgi:hypothetical protein
VIDVKCGNIPFRLMRPPRTLRLSHLIIVCAELAPRDAWDLGFAGGLKSHRYGGRLFK